MIKCDNISSEKVEKEKILVIFIDIRNSSELNNSFKPHKLHKIYQEFFFKTSNILSQNGFKNIDIQGDGTYGISNNKSQESIDKALNALNNLSFEDFQFTISVHYGDEWFSCFGIDNDNKNKQMAFFGNVVSIAKKWIQFSISNTKMIVSIEAYNFIGKEKMSKYQLKKKGNKIKKWKSYW